MGYIYSQSGGLCCERCGSPGAIKRHCPSNWCQPSALCHSCWDEAEKAGLPWIQAGVLLDNGNVFAWTAAGNYEVDRKTYNETIEGRHILDTSKAKPRMENHP